MVAAVSKLSAPHQFTQRLADFGLVVDALVVPAAWTVIIAELLIGIALVLGWRGSLAAASGLIVLFIGVLTYGTLLGLDIDCGCFGPAVHIQLRTQLLVDFGLLAACGIILLTARRRTGSAPAAASSAAPTQHESR